MNQGPDGDPPYTSEDLFGELVDQEKGPPRKREPGVGAPKRGPSSPIKVKVGEPGAAARKEPLPEELAALLDAFDAGPDAAPASKKPAAPVVEPPQAATVSEDRPTPPTPEAVEPLPDLPELQESERMTADAEAMSEFLQLTSRLRRATPEEMSLPSQADNVDLASVAEHAIEAATPEEAPGADAVLPLPQEVTGTGYGPYRLLEKIATGGMAEVFKAKRSGVAGFEKILAVKRILPHLSYNKEFVEMFIAEAKLVAGLQHPNIVQIFDLGKIGGTYYIAMEYVDGTDLRTILRKLKERSLRMPLDLAVYVVSKVAAGLHHAHQRKDPEGHPIKIVHRDVSPQNILISYDGEVKLTDFGIAKAATKASTTEKGALRGKLMYMSPEQAWGRPIDHRSDVFALGIVLYELITDQRPFLGSSDMSVLERVRRGSVAPPSSLHPEIPARLEKVLMKALEKDAADRQRDAAQMHQELEAMLAEFEPKAGARDLARFVNILFENAERGATFTETVEVERSSPTGEQDVARRAAAHRQRHDVAGSAAETLPVAQPARGGRATLG
jgi:serine/threonine protein kinase